MKNISTGFGLCVLGLGIAAWPVLDRLAPNANAGAVPAAASAINAAASAQTGPAIVWYGTSADTVYRAWSTGRVEATRGYLAVNSNLSCDDPNRIRWYQADGCGGNATRWFVVSDPAQGLTYRSDINFDEKVDGADLGALLADWGDAPRQDIPPSDCPLALINP